MTSSIKPPGSPPSGGPNGPTGTGGVRPPTEPGRGEAFKEVVESTRPPRAAEVQRPDAAQGPDALGELRAALSEGRVTASEAVEQLVQRALQRPEIQALPPVARAELEAVLRHALSEDPNLSSLVRDLEERGSS